jgi:hypothetical protein
VRPILNIYQIYYEFIMFKVSRDGLKKSTKHLMVISAIATLLIVAMGITTTINANAFNFGLLSKDDNLGSIDTNSLFSCVGAAINCVNENEENNNVIANNNEETPIPPPPPEEPGTLTVIKTVTCSSSGGEPSNEAVCDYAINQSPNFPDASDYAITVTGNNPNPSNFAGSNTPVDVTLEAGDYTVSEVLFSTGPIQTELDATSIVTDTIFTGDCTEDAPISQSAEGTIDAGESQTCNIENQIIITGGTTPPAELTVTKLVVCGSNIAPGTELCQSITTQLMASDYTIEIRNAGDNSLVNSFDGSSSGTEVDLTPGDYRIIELAKPSAINTINNIEDEFNVNIENQRSFTGDCTQAAINVANIEVDTGESYTCTVTNSINAFPIPP